MLKTLRQIKSQTIIFGTHQQEVSQDVKEFLREWETLADGSTALHPWQQQSIMMQANTYWIDMQGWHKTA
jgi:uncharacterized protein YcfL